jgi:hypothetical protein
MTGSLQGGSSARGSQRLPVRVIDFIGTVYPDADTLGLYEWASGLILLNVEHDTIQGLDQTVPADRWIMQTLSHEVAHLLQACMSPFLAEWQSKLFMTVTFALHDAVGGTDFGEDLYARGLAALSRGPLDATPETTHALWSLYDQIEGPGRYGVSVRGLIESHATFIEFRTHFERRTATASFADWIETQELPGQYRSPYDLVRFACGDRRADELFPVIVALALSTADPVESFALLLDELRRRSDLATAAEMLDQYLIADDPAHATASPALARLGSAAHPILERRSQLLSEHARTWFLAPWQVLEGEGLRALDPIVVFRPDETASIPMLTVSPQSRELWLTDPDHTERAWVPYLMLLSSLLGQILSGRRPAQATEIPWLAGIRNSPMIARVRDPSDVPQIVETLQQLHAQPDRSHYFGRLAFLFAAEDDPRPDGLIPWVRESVIALKRGLPMIGLYLDCTAEHPEQFQVWLTASSPLNATRADGAVDMGHPGALEALQSYLLGLIEEGHALGYDTEPIVANVLARVPLEVANALLTG